MNIGGGAVQMVLTTCVYCGTGCNLYLKVRDGRVVGVVPSKGHPVNEGRLCIKGWNVHEFIHDPNRLTSPLIRGETGLAETTWDAALDYVASRLNEVKQRYGPDAIGLRASSKCTNEENYLMQKFARAVIGTNNVDNCARLCHASTVVGLAVAFGSGAMTNSIGELEDAEVILVIGSNTTEQHPIIAHRILKAVEKGAKLLIADPRLLDLSSFASIHVRQRPGTDVALLNGIMNVIVSEGLFDEDFIRARTENFESFRKTVEKYDLKRVEEITGVPVEEIREMARLFAKSRRSTIVYSMGITQHTTGTDNVFSIANLAMVTGNVGREATGVNPLRGHQNVQGACDVGALPDLLPGYQQVSDEQARSNLERVWGVKLPEGKGLTLVELIDAAHAGKIKAMYIMGANPMVSDPDVGRVEEALKKLELLVVQDIFLSETARLAHVVLPAACFAEKDGTFTNTERRIQRVRKAVPPPGNSRADWEIIVELARRMGYEMHYDSPSEIMEEIAKVTPIYGGVSYKRLEGFGLQWPCPNADHPGTRFLHSGKFSRGLGLFNPVEYAPPSELTDEDYPFTLTTGRVLFQFHTGTMTRRSPTLEREEPEGYVEINPKDAGSLGIMTGGLVRLTSRRGSICVKAVVTERTPGKTVFVPFHFAEAAANALTNPALDPRAKIPELKVCAVRVERA